MTNVLAVDPGDRNVGYAYFCTDFEDDQSARWADRVNPAQFVMHYEQLAARGEIDVVVCEAFHLYPWMAQKQGFSDLKTPQLIGVIRYIAEKQGLDFVLQGASIKKIAFTRMRVGGVALHGKNQHARDAEAHGWYYLHKKEL